MAKKITIKQYEDLIGIHYNTIDARGKKIPLMVYGTYGIGKSEVVRAKAKEIALKQNKTFVEWNDTTQTQKLEIYENSEKYFVMLDIRLSEFDASDIKGLPIESQEQKMKEWLNWKVSFFVKLLENQKSDGILLFDEINLATPLVISSCYKILYDRFINDSRINDNWLIMGCGNLATDKAYTHDLASPVRDRGSEAELISATGEDWIKEFAIPKGIEVEIQAFILTKPTALHDADDESDREQKATTPRGWARLDALLKQLKANNQMTHDKIELVTTTAIGEGIGREFVAFWKVSQAVKIEDLIKNPELMKNIKEIDIKYFIVSALSEKFGNKKIDFDKVMEFSQVLNDIGNAEFVALLWRLSFKYNEKAFKDGFLKSKSPLKTTFHKYLGDI